MSVNFNKTEDLVSIKTSQSIMENFELFSISFMRIVLQYKKYLKDRRFLFRVGYNPKNIQKIEDFEILIRPKFKSIHDLCFYLLSFQKIREELGAVCAGQINNRFDNVINSVINSTNLDVEYDIEKIKSNLIDKYKKLKTNSN